ncbi:MAG: class II fructose-bisphosphate aldolase [bacterium]|nr:class II fructose-bisphosphate aldolase [bacterium]
MTNTQIYEAAAAAGIRISSIAPLYAAIARGDVSQQFSVPAVNVRGLTTLTAAAIFRAAKQGDVGAFIFELARSEMGYTEQPPEVFVPLILAGALEAGWKGPVFIQGDHYQAKAARSGVPVVGEIDAIKALVRSSIAAGMLNIDIDMSTLVDLEKTSVAEQQIPNVRYTNELVSYIRSLESGIAVSIGGELGHIGGTNSTKEECEVFLSQVAGLRKLSIQTGTEHGGVVNADGTLAKMTVDFNLHKELTEFIRSRFGLAGTVQHGASTLPDEAFVRLPQVKAVEVHLATGIQNLVFDHPAFPSELTKQFENWIFAKRAAERKENMTDAQFVYRERKRVWGPFKQQLLEMSPSAAEQLSQAIEWRMGEFFNWLGVKGTRSLVDGLITHQEFVPDLSIVSGFPDDTAVTDGLAD